MSRVRDNTNSAKNRSAENGCVFFTQNLHYISPRWVPLSWFIGRQFKDKMSYASDYSLVLLSEGLK